MFIAALFTIAKIWKQLNCPSTDEWIKKIWCTYTIKTLYTYIHKMQYYSPIKRDDILPFAAMWVVLEIKYYV